MVDNVRPRTLAVLVNFRALFVQELALALLPPPPPRHLLWPPSHPIQALCGLIVTCRTNSRGANLALVYHGRKKIAHSRIDLGFSSMFSPATTALTRSVSGKAHIANARDANAKSATARFGNKKGYLENRTKIQHGNTTTQRQKTKTTREVGMRGEQREAQTAGSHDASFHILRSYMSTAPHTKAL